MKGKGVDDEPTQMAKPHRYIFFFAVETSTFALLSL